MFCKSFESDGQEKSTKILILLKEWKSQLFLSFLFIDILSR